ncbi:MAG: hypothetical protein ACPG4X_16485 [Pikeienuella sp.]
MARSKETIWQKDFSLGEVRPEAEERDDTNLIGSSSFGAANTISLSTGQCEIRPGLLHLATTTADNGFDIDLGGGRAYELQVTPTGYLVLDVDGATVTSGSVDWAAIGDFQSGYAFADIDFWVVASPDTSSILIGAKYFQMRALTVDALGVWSFGEAAFPTGQNGVPSVPFFNPELGLKTRVIKGSGRAVTIETDGFDLFTSAHVGTYFRQNGVPILITAVADSETASGTSSGPVSRTLTITVADGGDFYEGDAVTHKNLGGTGFITGISGNDLTVFSTGSYKDFDATGNLIGPNAKESISTVTVETTGAHVALWDVQMLSGAYGYANWGQIHQSRLFLCGHPGDSLAYAVSQTGDILNFTAGSNDADGFVEKIGVQRGGELRYIVSAEDLLFFTTRGLYYQPTRSGDAITPLTIAPVPFSQIGVSNIAPVAVDDGAIFVDSVGQQVFAAVLSGDVYRSWKTRSITKYHSHLVDDPVFLGATIWGSERPEQFIYVVNADGTAAVGQWDREQDLVSWRPWTTEGSFKSIYQSVGKVHAVVDRTIASVAVRYRERFEYGVYVDCCAALEVSSDDPQGVAGQAFFAGVTRFATHLAGHTAQVYSEGWDFGDLFISAEGKATNEGSVFDYPTDAERIVQVGLSLAVDFVPWSRRSVSTQRGTREVKRVVDLMVTVQATGTFTIDGQDFGGYRIGDDLAVPPVLRSQEYRVMVGGGQSFRRIPIRSVRPGPFRLLKIGYRVTV